MRIRTASATAIVAALGLALVAPAAAQAAPEEIAPRFASSAAAPAGSWAGLEPITSDGTSRVDRPITGSTTLELRVHEPAGSTGRVLDPGLEGTVSLDVVQLAPGGPGTTGAVLTAWPSAPGTVEPTGWPGANDVLTSAFSIDQRTQLWAFAYTFDFSGLAGGVLPAGSRIAAADIDVCGTGAGAGIDERFAATSDASGPWLDYQYRILRSSDASSPPIVTFDAETGAYGVAPSCNDREMIETFVTTQPVSTLTIELANRRGAGITRFGLLLPTAAPAAAIAIVKTTNGEDVEAAPGPSLAIGDDVDYGFAVTNPGATDLAAVTVTDDQLDATAIDCGDGTNVIPSLAAGETTTCAATGIVVEGQHQNTASVTGTPADSRGAAIVGAVAPTAQDSSWHVGVVDPSASIATSASASEAQPGASVTYTTTVEDTGVTTLDGAVVEAAVPDGLEVTDAGGGVITDDVVRWEIGELASGETATVTLTGIVRETQPGAVLELRATGSASVGETTVPLLPVEACVDDEAASCAVVTVAAVTSPPPTTSAPPSTAPPSVGPGASGALPATGSDLAPAAWMLAMATLLVGLGVVLRRRAR